MPLSLQPAFVGNLKTARASALKSALQCPLGACSIFANAAGYNVPGPSGENYYGTTASQYGSPFDLNLNTSGSGFGWGPLGAFRAGIYAAFVGGGSALTHCKATIIDNTDATIFALLCDLQTPFNPAALPAGILSAKAVTNGIFQVPRLPTFASDYQSAATTGWRIIFDSAALLGNDHDWNPSLNLVTAEVDATGYTGEAIFMSQWNYWASNPRLAITNPGNTLAWFYDGSLPRGLDHWQLQGQATPDPNFYNLATYPAATMTVTDPTYFGLWSFFQIFGCDSSGNQITPASNIA